MARSLEELRKQDPAEVVGYLDVREVQLAPLLFWHLRRRGAAALAGERLSGELEWRYRRNVARNFVLERRLTDVLAALNARGIRVLVLKGAAAFTAELAALRDAFVLSDLDLMVKPADMRGAAEILTSLGYAPAGQQQCGRAVKQEFAGADTLTRIDLHSALFWTSGAADYLSYGPSDPWEGSRSTTLEGQPVDVLSAGNQICHRLIHDAIGHQDALLARSTSRLYYLCAVVDFYRDAVDWTGLLQKLKRKGTDRLLRAYLYYGHQELGLRLPAALERSHHRAPVEVALLDAVASSPDRLADYSHRTSVALLTDRRRQERLGQASAPLAQSAGMHGADDRGPRAARAGLAMKRLCLQSITLAYLSMSGLRHWMRRRLVYGWG